MLNRALQNPNSVLAHPAFRRFWLARIFSRAASQIQAVAVGWQIYDLTGSTLNLGLIGLAQFLPMALLTLPAGHVADRYNRRLVAGSSSIAAGLVMALLALGSLSPHLPAWVIYGAVMLIGVVRAFQTPSLTSMLPGTVPPALFPQAAALSTSAGQTAFIVGPALGGLLYGLGAAVPYAVGAAMLLASGWITLRIVVEQAPPKPDSASLRSVFDGIHFIRRHPAILGAISLDLFAVLLGGATALMPVYARDILHAGPWGLGLLRAAPAIGALSLSLVLARYPLRRRMGVRMFAAVIAFGLATMVFAVSTSLILSIAALIALGAADVISMVVRQSLVQIGTPDAMRGRVNAVNGLFIGTSNQLGEFESGVTAALFGTVPSVLIGGIGTIAVALLWMRLFPSLRRMDGLPPPS